MLKTKRLVVLSIALSDSETVVDIIEPHSIVCHVADKTTSAASTESSGFLGIGVWPDFDASSF